MALTLSYFLQMSGKGLAMVFAEFGRDILELPAPVAITGGVLLAALAPESLLLTVGAPLWTWATEGWPDAIEFGVLRNQIERERLSRNFEKDALHIGICGPAGSGKTSVVNALRGLRNNDPRAGRAGSTESTLVQTSYRADTSLGPLYLHDCPGAGTQRIPAKDYYAEQKLYLFDQLLILHGERLGEVRHSLCYKLFPFYCIRL